jgi:hypothetical protein
MACLHPLKAYQSRNGNVTMGRAPPDTAPLALPCGGCLGCRTARAKEWALRCQLELQEHDHAVFTTLTYDEKYLPPTLNKRHLTLWLKKLRKRTGTTQPVRFFACGEYGEQNARPHYHAILYGLSTKDTQAAGAAMQSTTGQQCPYQNTYTMHGSKQQQQNKKRY